MATFKGEGCNQSSSVISEFSKKLCGIDRSLSTDMQQAMGFLCLAVCPKSCIYPRNIKQTPTLMDCYSGLCDNFVTQRIAVSLLLHFLQLVGCLQSSIDELQRVALKSQPAADEKDINQLPPDAKKKLNFHKFLLSIYRELPDDDRKVVISLTSDLVMPPRHQSYTACLIVHFIVLMEGKVITPNDLRPLQECLHVIGHLELLDKIDGYCQQAGLSLERTARPHIERVSLHFGSSEPTTGSMKTSENSCVWSKSFHGLQTEPHIASSFSHHVAEGASNMSPHVLTTPQQEWGRTGTSVTATSHTTLGKPVLSGTEGQEGNGEEFQLRHYDLAVDRHEGGIMTTSASPQRGSSVKILQACRLSKHKGYLKWTSLDSVHKPKYSVTIQPEGESEIHQSFTDSVVYVATKLEERKQYNVIVCSLAPDGSKVGEDHTSIPLLTRSEDLPVPSEVRVECDPDIHHLKVTWNKLTSRDVVGYVIRYETEEQKRYVHVEGAERTEYILQHASMRGLYVDVAAKMKGDLVGPFSHGVDVPLVEQLAVTDETHDPPPEQGRQLDARNGREETPSVLPVQQGTSPEAEDRVENETLPGKCTRSTKWLTCACSTIIVLVITTVASAGVFGYFARPIRQHKSHYIEQGDTTDLGTYDSSWYSMADISGTLNDSVITVYSQSGACRNVPVYPNMTYHVEGSMNFTSSSINRIGIPSANGYFAHSSVPTFQLNATGPESRYRSNCSAAFFIFDTQTDYDMFLSFGNNTATSVKQICFDVFNDTTEFLNTSFSFPVDDSTYLFIALFTKNVDYLSYHIAGDRNYYNHSDFLNSTKCAIATNISDCSFPLPRQIFDLDSDCYVCILAFWDPEPLSHTQIQLLTTETSYTISSSFPHNFVQFSLLVLSSILLIFLLVSCVAFAFCCCYHKCYSHSYTVNPQSN